VSHIKSQGTKASVSNSRAEVDRLLRRYGAAGTNMNATFDDLNLPLTITVSFVVPDRVGSTRKVPVSLPIDVRRVYDALYGRPESVKWDVEKGKNVRSFNPKGYNAKKMEQAERVAWRNLVLWIDAALSAAAIGLQTITEAFYAHTVIQLESGGTMRLSQVVEGMQGKLPPGVRALLASPAEIEE
jgi:hypothetical protein